MTEIWQVATRDTAPEWFDLKADALERVHVLVGEGKVPVCVVVPVWGEREREGRTGRERVPRLSDRTLDPLGAMFGDSDNRGIQERESE